MPKPRNTAGRTFGGFADDTSIRLGSLSLEIPEDRDTAVRRPRRRPGSGRRTSERPELARLAGFRHPPSRADDGTRPGQLVSARPDSLFEHHEDQEQNDESERQLCHGKALSGTDVAGTGYSAVELRGIVYTSLRGSGGVTGSVVGAIGRSRPLF